MSKTLTAAVVTAAVFASAPGTGRAQLVPALNAGGAQPQVGSTAGASTGQLASAAQGSAAQGNAMGGVPNHFPPAVSPISPEGALSTRERRHVAMATRWRQRACGTRMGGDGKLYMEHGACEPTVVCAPFRVCTISLEPGENITDKPDLGDPRWTTHPRVSGTGSGRTIHVSVKPSDAGLDTNMTIPTDRRLISVRLISRARDYMPFIVLADSASGSDAAWSQVLSQSARASAMSQAHPCDTTPTIPPSSYKIGRGDYGWRPLQVYAVASTAGTKTCIDLPSDISSMDVPVLVALDAAGAEQVVSYRQIGRRLFVDRLIDRAILVAGVGGSQQSVSIDRRGAR